MRSFKLDVAPILDEMGSGGCSASSMCHGTVDNGKLKLPKGDTAAIYKALLGYSLDATPGPAGPYVVPCDPDASKLLCNLALKSGNATTCGLVMPPIGGLTDAEFNIISEWIACGALDN